MEKNREQFKVTIKKVKYGLTDEDVHKFVDEFTSRYSTQLNEGKDMRFIYDFELGCLETGLKHFYLGCVYVNGDGDVMKIIDRREDFLIIEYDGDCYEADYWHDDCLEYCVLDGMRWSADTMQCKTDGE